MEESKLVSDTLSDIKFSDFFELEEIQHLQDLFSEAHGVASLITLPDGTPITNPSNFCRLCEGILRSSEKGFSNCFKSNSVKGPDSSSGPAVRQCLIGGLWNASANITIGGKHIANWLIGQVRNEDVDEGSIKKYAEEIGADKEDLIDALYEMPIVSFPQFKKVAELLFAFVNMLSEKAYANLNLKTQISEREKANKLLMESEEKFRSVVEQSIDGMVITDDRGIVAVWNASMESITGILQGEAIGRPFFEIQSQLIPDELKTPEFLKSLEKGMKNIYESKENVRGETNAQIIRCKNGDRKIIQATFLIVKSNNSMRFVSVIHDITERKMAEEKLRESEQKLSTFFSSMTEMVVLHELVFDEQGVPVNYRLYDCNKAYTEITGIKKEDAIGRLATEVYQTEVAPYLEEFSKVGTSGDAFEYNTYYAPMDKHFLISVVSPRKNHFATITSDITAIKQIQEIVSAKNKELENYLYIASHDLRSPLVNIQGFSQRLQKQADSIKNILAEDISGSSFRENIERITNDDIPKTLNFIFSNVNKMDSLINGLLQISRTGRIRMTILKIDMNRLLSIIIAIFNYQITEISAIVTVGDLPSCYGDEDQLNQLFSNIIGNALKYRDPERQLVVEISGRIQYNKVVYIVRDNGKGIAPRHLEKIWDIFYRVDSTSHEAGEGIGLSLAKRIAEKHNGRIWMESEEGKGSTFYIELQRNKFSE